MEKEDIEQEKIIENVKVETEEITILCEHARKTLILENKSR